MRIKNLKINNLRNISAADIVPHERLNILYGDNGAGKTSVIESLVVLAKGRSFRTGLITSLIGPNDSLFRVVAEIGLESGADHRIGLERGRSQWQARVDGRDVQQISELAGYLPFTLMEPNSHGLVSGTPDVRRKYLDWGVFHVKHEFLATWRHYSHAVRQRNAALRAGDERVARSLDPQLIRLGSEIDRERRRQVAALSAAVERLGPTFRPAGSAIRLNYDPGWRGETLEEALEAGWRRDLERGATHSGPHRADLLLTADDQPARERMSRGEQKLLAAALLLAQADILSSQTPPLLFLDDLASEFDEQRREDVLTAGFALGAQLWVTGTRAEDYRDQRSGGCAMFHVKQGVICRQSDG